MSNNLQGADSNDVQPMNGLGSTELHVEIKLPWQDTFGLGMGIDALTGESKVSPFEEVNWTSSASERTALEVTATSQLIRHCHEVRHDFHVDTAATVNPCSLVAVGTGLEYLRSWKVSSSATLIESKVSGHYPFENPPKNKFKLSDEASKCLMETPERFRDRYGDYFIYGVQSGFTFHTVFKQEDQKQTEGKSFGATAVASLVNVLDIQKAGAGSSDVEASDFVAEDYRLVHSGCDLGLLVGSPVDKDTNTSDLKPVKTLTLSEVREMTRTLLTTPQPCVPQVALLKHYSFLYTELSNTVPVPKSAFSDVRKLGELADVLEVDCRHEAVTQVDRNEAESLIQRFRHERPSLVKNNTARELIEQGLRAAANMMDSMIGRFCLESRLGEPGIQAQPKRGSDSSRRRYARWQFGVNPDKVDPNDKYSDITIRLPQREVKVCQRFVKAKVVKKNSPAKLHFGCNSSRDMVAMENDVWVTGLKKIVGWTLSCDNDNDEKVSFKFKGGIKEPSLEIAAEAAVGRVWHLRVTFMHMYD